MSVSINCVPKCLEGLIGIRSNCEIQNGNNTCKTFIEDLPGINIPMLADVANLTNIESGEALALIKIEKATLNVLNELHKYLFQINGYQLNNLLEAVNFGKAIDSAHIPTPLFRGLVIEKDIHSAMSKIQIISITIHSKTTGQTILRIEDGANVTTQLVDLQANQPEIIYLNKTFETDKVRILLNNNNISMSSTPLEISSSCCGSSSNESSYLKASGWDGVVRSTDSFGITAQSTLVCDITPLACILKNQLERPILYQFGIEIMKEILVSNRINGNIERTELIREQIKEYEKEFDNNLKFALNSSSEMLGMYDKKCLRCMKSRWVEMIP